MACTSAGVSSESDGTDVATASSAAKLMAMMLATPRAPRRRPWGGRADDGRAGETRADVAARPWAPTRAARRAMSDAARRAFAAGDGCGRREERLDAVEDARDVGAGVSLPSAGGEQVEVVDDLGVARRGRPHCCRGDRGREVVGGSSWPVRSARPGSRWPPAAGSARPGSRLARSLRSRPKPSQRRRGSRSRSRGCSSGCRSSSGGCRKIGRGSSDRSRGRHRRRRARPHQRLRRCLGRLRLLGLLVLLRRPLGTSRTAATAAPGLGLVIVDGEVGEQGVEADRRRRSAAPGSLRDTAKAESRSRRGAVDSALGSAVGVSGFCGVKTGVAGVGRQRRLAGPVGPRPFGGPPLGGLHAGGLHVGDGFGRAPRAANDWLGRRRRDAEELIEARLRTAGGRGGGGGRGIRNRCDHWLDRRRPCGELDRSRLGGRFDRRRPGARTRSQPAAPETRPRAAAPHARPHAVASQAHPRRPAPRRRAALRRPRGHAAHDGSGVAQAADQPECLAWNRRARGGTRARIGDFRRGGNGGWDFGRCSSRPAPR